MTEIDVSRETHDDLKVFADLVLKWTPRINLISKSSIDQIWTRHVLDSLQIAHLVETKPHWIDMGSGGGFPGVVVAIHAKNHRPQTKVTLIESDTRKSTFLRTAIRELNLNAEVISDRIEDAEPQSADILSARALSDLNTLLGFVERHLQPDGCALFQKGANWKKEVEIAQQAWTFEYEALKSQTDAAAAILKIKGVSRD